MKSSELLRIAMARVPGHLHKGTMFGEDGESACGIGHVQRVVWYAGYHPGDAHVAAISEMSKVAGEQYPDRSWNSARCTFPQFNDHEDTTEDEVVAVMEKAAIQLEERGL